MSKETREIAVAIVDSFNWKADVEGLVICDPRKLADAIDAALVAEREKCAKVATKKAETLRKAAHVVQQPTEEALRMAELAILTADDIATTIRKGDD